MKALNDYSRFWGRYRVDAAQKRMVFTARGAVNPTITEREFSRTIERSGDLVTLTSVDERGGDARQQQEVHRELSRVG